MTGRVNAACDATMNVFHDLSDSAVISPRYQRGMSATTYVRRCLELAEIAALAGDTAVGALIVRGDEVVGEGVERTRATLDPSAHAEVEAIRLPASRYARS